MIKDMTLTNEERGNVSRHRLHSHREIKTDRRLRHGTPVCFFSLGCNLVLLAGSSIVSQQTVDERRDVTDVHDAVVIDVGRIFAEERV